MILLYWMWRIGMFLTSLVPPRWSIAAAGAMGSTAYYVFSLRRQVAKENFARVMGMPPDHPEVRRIARQSFRNYARYLRDVMLYPNIPTSELEKRIEFHQPENISRALEMGRGVILVSAHFGNMDMPSAVIAKQFKPITLVAESLRPKKLMDFLTEMREARGVRLYPYDRAPRKIIEALKRNEMTGFLLDFGVTHHLDIPTVTINFFGTPTAFPTGPAQLALLTGSPIVVGHTVVESDGKIHVHVTEPIVAERSERRQQQIGQIMQDVAARFEVFIRQHPEQWYMFRPMWRTKMESRFKVRRPQYEPRGS